MPKHCTSCKQDHEIGNFCPDCGSPLVQASRSANPGVSGPTFGDVGLIKGDIRTEDHSRHVHYHGIDPARHQASPQTFCYCCSRRILDNYFQCESCGRPSCHDCQDETTRQCRKCATSATLRGQKQIAPGMEHLRYPHDRVSLQFRDQERMRNVCLLAGSCATLGRRRGNDIVLRLWPETHSNSLLSNKISRTHATVSFEPRGLMLANAPPPSCETGSRCGALNLAAGEQSLLRPGEEVCLAQVLSLQVQTFPIDRGIAAEAYREFEASLEAAAAPQQTNIRSVCLRRTDNLAGLEEYILFHRHLKIGSAPGCELYINHPSVRGTHARIHWLAGTLWLEACQVAPVVRVRGQIIPLHHLVPLHPELPITLGEIEISVEPYQQFYLDVTPLGLSE